MRKDGFSLGLYLFALGMGVASGGLFIQAAYHKGKADAYLHISDELKQFQELVDVEEA